MGIKYYKPTSPGRRDGSVLDRAELTRQTPEKSLLQPLKKTGGRNNLGRVTSRHKGGGAKRRYRMVDFKRNKDGVMAKVAHIEYDPNRTAYIALLHYVDGEKAYIVWPKGLQQGDMVSSGIDAEPKVGCAMKLKDLPLGIAIHNIEMRPGQGAKLVRSAGASARLAAREGNYALINMPSGELRKIHVECRATIGEVGNADHKNVKLGKAGRNRHLGKRPHVRGAAMYPAAHPHGGGEGRTMGKHPVSPWGQPAKGFKTRQKRKTSSKFIVRRRKTGK
ncbi:MAG: 50S ribosomal protein L2 [Planctomycetota bacterium]|jgi:large subunit ribosomal protein L2|nr:50S ribosomal protein L2 [Planctomycetota bacterium]MDG2310718.1 50S ribosomal protein L2 [Planctomycetota bacterium]|tara:strand:- start:290 stop:1120 length:831 start_codon:yes stop_codon:yes gene_type:complete